NSVIKLVEEVLIDTRKTDEAVFDYADYWAKRLNQNFNIEGVGYLGLGQIYNSNLYHLRMEIIDKVWNKLGIQNFEKLDVLEFGPGVGIFTEYFKDKGAIHYSAIDITDKSVMELSQKYP